MKILKLPSQIVFDTENVNSMEFIEFNLGEDKIDSLDNCLPSGKYTLSYLMDIFKPINYAKHPIFDNIVESHYYVLL